MKPHTTQHTLKVNSQLKDSFKKNLFSIIIQLSLQSAICSKEKVSKISRKCQFNSIVFVKSTENYKIFPYKLNNVLNRLVGINVT